MRKGEDTKGVIRRTDNIMAKEDKRTNNILQSTARKTIDWIEQHEPHKKYG